MGEESKQGEVLLLVSGFRDQHDDQALVNTKRRDTLSSVIWKLHQPEKHRGLERLEQCAATGMGQ